MERAERLLRAHLYYRPSHLRRYSPSRKRYDIEIGQGLFSSRDIAANTHIVYFVGELITDTVTLNARSVRNNRGGYVLSNVTKTAGLDCYETCARGQCLASFSNSPYNCYNIVRQRTAAANARLTVRSLGNGEYIWGLISTVAIPAHEEILWNYGANYMYPEID